MHIRRNLKRPALIIHVAGLLLLLTGCENPSPPAQSTRSSSVDIEPATPRPASPAVVEKPAAKPKVAIQVAVAPNGNPNKPAPQPKKFSKPSGPPAMPPVLMSERHRKTCKVFVGDPLPEFELSDLTGKQKKLSTEYGKKLTVICFFGGDLPAEDQELVDLGPEVVDRYGQQDVGVIGIAVGQTRNAAAASVKKLGVKFPVLVDTDRKAYGLVATDYLPRTYVVDASGKILWLDLEYSASTRRQINDAIRHVLETKQ